MSDKPDNLFQWYKVVFDDSTKPWFLLVEALSLADALGRTHKFDKVRKIKSVELAVATLVIPVAERERANIEADAVHYRVNWPC